MSFVHRPWSLPNPSFLKWAQGSLSMWHWIRFSGAGMKQDWGRRLIEVREEQSGAGPAAPSSGLASVAERHLGCHRPDSGATWPGRC